jgi:hypothetical protein
VGQEEDGETVSKFQIHKIKSEEQVLFNKTFRMHPFLFHVIKGKKVASIQDAGYKELVKEWLL